VALVTPQHPKAANHWNAAMLPHDRVLLSKRAVGVTTTAMERPKPEIPVPQPETQPATPLEIPPLPAEPQPEPTPEVPSPLPETPPGPLPEFP